MSDADRQGQGKGPTGGKRKDIHERALGLLAVRQRSRRELERRLIHAGFESEAVGLSKFNEDDEKPVVLEDVAPPAPELTEQEAKVLDEKVEKAKAKATAG